MNLPFLKLSCLTLIFLINFSLKSQNEPKWVAPLEIPIKLSGTFGELRNNHFHAGLDIKTQGRQGLKVRSVQEGRISRIRVSVSGYGKTLYIEHPNGTTSVYAHLKKFAPKIEEFVKKNQYKKESFIIQIFPKVDEFPIDAGELIGYSGNTGGSNGPHLHFEMRKTIGQLPINAMRYPLVIEDTQRPQVQNLYLYSGTDPFSIQKEYPLTKINDSVYSTAGLSASGKINVGLRFFDRQNLSYNKNGIYSVSVRLNGVEHFSYQMDQISFDDSKYINLMIDYKELKEKKRRIQRFFAHSEQKFSFLKNVYQNGEMRIDPGKSYQLLIELNDYNKNTSYVEVYLTGTKEMLNQKKKENNLIKTMEESLYEFKGKSVYFEKDSFFDKVNLKVEDHGDTLHVGEDLFPMRKAYTIKYKIPKGDSLTISQSFLSILSKKGKPIFFSSFKKDGYLQGKSKSLGRFLISRDSISPEIKAINFKEGQWLSNYDFMKLKISDDFSGLKKFRGEINGKWILLEHEPKNNSLIYDFSDIEFEEALNQLTIEAEDQVGNKTIFKRNFYRKTE